MALGLILILLFASPAFETFDEPLDPLRWYVGVPNAPSEGRLRLPKEGWIVSRGVPDAGIRRLEVVVSHQSGALELTFHNAREPLSSPCGPPIVLPRGKGARTLVVTPEGAQLDGAPLAWKGTLRGTFRLRARKGAAWVDEVRVAPRTAGGVELSELERRIVHFATTPARFRAGDREYGRVTMLLWDVEVAFLFRRGDPSFGLLAAPVRGAPVLGVLVQDGIADAAALAASSRPLAMRDWGDERRNLSPDAFRRYLSEQYAVLSLLRQAQRALNAALPGRKDLGPLVHLAVIRHASNAHAAAALATASGGRKALAALRKALGKSVDLQRASADQLRAAAGAAARAILGEPPPEWPGFRFDPRDRYVTIEQAKDLVR